MPLLSGVRATPPATERQVTGLRASLCRAFGEDRVTAREGGCDVRVGHGTAWAVGYHAASSHQGGVEGYVSMLRSVADSVESMEASLLGDDRQ